jgi:hypothetical protein
MRASHCASGKYLMPVRGLLLATERPLRLNPYGEHCRRLYYYSLERGVRAGRVSTTSNGKMVSVAEARRMIAYARAQGCLSPEAA